MPPGVIRIDQLSPPRRGGRAGGAFKIKDFTFFVFIAGLKVNFFLYRVLSGEGIRIKDVTPEMLKSHETGLVRAAGAFTAPQWIEDPRGT